MNLAHIAKAVRINDAMKRRRDQVRLLLGERYRNEVALGQDVIRAVMEADKLEAVPATLKLCKEAQSHGHDTAVSILIAALVEMLEA